MPKFVLKQMSGDSVEVKTTDWEEYTVTFLGIEYLLTKQQITDLATQLSETEDNLPEDLQKIMSTVDIIVSDLLILLENYRSPDFKNRLDHMNLMETEKGF